LGLVSLLVVFRHPFPYNFFIPRRGSCPGQHSLLFVRGYSSIRLYPDNVKTTIYTPVGVNILFPVPLASVMGLLRSLGCIGFPLTNCDVFFDISLKLIIFTTVPLLWEGPPSPFPGRGSWILSSALFHTRLSFLESFFSLECDSLFFSSSINP